MEQEFTNRSEQSVRARRRPGTFLEAAQRVLTEAREPLHYREITARAVQNGYIETDGHTPWATMNSRIIVSMRDSASPFIRVRPGIFGLKAWQTDGQATLEVTSTRRTRQPYVPFFPNFDEVRSVLPAWVGARRADILGMRSRIFELTGTPQETVDWNDPNIWINERLSGSPREWAQRTWTGSRQRVNPRHITGHWLLATNYGLLVEGPDGRLELGSDGRQFLERADSEIVREIDDQQGLLKLLALVADSSGGTGAELFDPWKRFLLEETNTRADSTAKSHLYYRLRNLIGRGLVERSGTVHKITQQGIEYLARSGGATGAESDASNRIRQLLREQQQEIRESIRDLLFDMDPYAFEGLVKLLLDDIGYQNVRVTSRSNDKGIDVVGDIELGITSVREVVQVKRQKSNVQRPILDALRGVLHRFGAVRGTIITTSSFSKGTESAAFEQGAAPITLIDGNKLVDLLIEHEIGVKKRSLELWELDPSAFTRSTETIEGGETEVD